MEGAEAGGWLLNEADGSWNGAASSSEQRWVV